MFKERGNRQFGSVRKVISIFSFFTIVVNKIKLITHPTSIYLIKIVLEM